MTVFYVVLKMQREEENRALTPEKKDKNHGVSADDFSFFISWLFLII